MGKSETKQAAGLEQVREILRKAAGGNKAAYGGLALWEFSREQLLAASLHGTSLIAPETKGGSCCHGPKTTDPSASRGPRSTKRPRERWSRPGAGMRRRGGSSWSSTATTCAWWPGR